MGLSMHPVLVLAFFALLVSGIRKNSRFEEKLGASPAKAFNEQNTGWCKPRLTRSTCSKEKYRGVLVAFHGFTACTDQYDELIPKWNDVCWDVFAPVLPGHGLGGHIVTCGWGFNNPCSVSFNGGALGFNLAKLPTGYATQYSRFAQKVTAVAEAELKFRTSSLPGSEKTATLAVVGLSLGSAMAFRTVVEKPEAWSRALLIHPMLGLGQEGIDFDLRNCLKAAVPGTDFCGPVLTDSFVRNLGLTGMTASYVRRQIAAPSSADVQSNIMKFYSKISKHAPRLFASALLNAPVVWGGACDKITRWGRDGFCAFQQKHILGVHVFGIDSLALNFKGKFPVTQVLLTETDGITRNGLAYSGTKHIKCAAPEQDVHICIHPFKEGQQHHHPNAQAYWDKENCLPHASLGSKENNDMDHRWWEPKLTSDLVNFFNGTNNIGSTEAFNRTDSNVCVDLPLGNGDEKKPWMRSLVAPYADPTWSDC